MLTSFLILFSLLQFSCTQTDNSALPIFGNREVVNGDTIYHTIPPFSFVNQDGKTINDTSVKDKIYVVDIFFTTCTTICPRVKNEMLRIYDRFENEDRLMLLSHSMDVKHDTVEVLKEYAKKLHVSTPRWHFLTGDEDKIFEMADEYFIAAMKDSTSADGFDHSGRLILVDQQGHVRASGEGTDPESVDEFILKIEKLLREK